MQESLKVVESLVYTVRSARHLEKLVAEIQKVAQRQPAPDFLGDLVLTTNLSMKARLILMWTRTRLVRGFDERRP
jgi:hypothetical protein